MSKYTFGPPDKEDVLRVLKEITQALEEDWICVHEMVISANNSYQQFPNFELNLKYFGVQRNDLSP